MSAINRRGVVNSVIAFKPNRRKTMGICESVERRMLLTAITFSTPNTFPVAGAESPILSGLFNGPDTPLDLAVATPTGVQILTGSSGGTFSLGTKLLFPGTPAATSPFFSGNYTGSNQGDVILDTSSVGNGQLTYESSNQDGTFTQGSGTQITDGGAGFTPISGRSGDVNNDGDEDLAVVGKPGTGSQLVLAVMLSNGDQTFTETDYPIAGSNAAGNLTNEEVFAGITNEVVVYDGSGGNLDVFSSTGNGIFTQLTPVPLAATRISVGAFDSNSDLAVANGNQVTEYENQNDGTFIPSTQGAITLPGPITAMNTADFNLDGNLDIITNQGILFGNGDGTFNATPQALPASLGSTGVFNSLITPDWHGNGVDGFAGFAAAGGAVVTAFNQTPVGVSVDLSSNNNPANPGADVQFSASVSSAVTAFDITPTGTITFINGTTPIGSASLVDGTATFDAGSSLPGGNSNITAQYSGDSKFAAGASTVLTQTILSNTATTLSSNENPSIAGDDVIFTAVVTGNDGAGDVPSGNVEFFDNGVDLGGGGLDDTGTAIFDTTGTLTVGSQAITAQYQADDNYSVSQSATLTQVVNQPGLVPTVASTTLPTAIVAGTVVHGTLTITLDNQTSTAVSAANITAYASTNGEIAGATPLVVDAPKHGLAIAGGKTRVLKLNVKHLPELADGTYRLIVQVSSSTNQLSNSVTGPAISIAAPFVHLAGTVVATPAVIKPGKSITLTITLSNSGNIVTLNAPFNIGLSVDGQTESTPLENLTDKLRIKPGKSGIIHLHVKIPLTQAPSSYNPFVTGTDDGDTVTLIGPAFEVG